MTTWYGDLTSRINKKGDLFFLRDGKGPNEFVVSHQQVELLRLLVGSEGQRSARTRIGYALFTSRPLTNSQRASVSRMIRRLVGLNIVLVEGRDVVLTLDGQDFTSWILNEFKYDEVMDYMRSTSKR